jgi:hypothetical protein
MSKPHIIIVAGGATGAAESIRSSLKLQGLNIQVLESEEIRKDPFDTTPALLITNPYSGMDELVYKQLSEVDKHASKKQIKNLSRYHNCKK